MSGHLRSPTVICAPKPSPNTAHRRFCLLSEAFRVIDVIAVITAQGETMKSTTEQTETARAAATTETKPTKKAAAGARRANVAPTKAKAGKKTTPKKKAPRSARNDVREGSKATTILEMLKRPDGVTAKELLSVPSGPCSK